MGVAEDLLQSLSHRPWELPKGLWSYYQEWNRAIFLHWKVPEERLKPLIPIGLEIDTYNGECWVSLVAFTMEKIRPKGFPSLATISNFHEINVRTYLKHQEKHGVYFLNIEAQKQASVFIAKLLSGLPYEKATIERLQKENVQQYIATNQQKGFYLNAEINTGEKIINKTALDSWLTEKYCLFLHNNYKLYSYDIHHMPWELHKIDLLHLSIQYSIGNILLNRKPDLAHYSPGVKVVAWKKENIN